MIPGVVRSLSAQLIPLMYKCVSAHPSLTFLTLINFSQKYLPENTAHTFQSH